MENNTKEVGISEAYKFLITPMKETGFCERLFYKMVIVTVKVKKIK